MSRLWRNEPGVRGSALLSVATVVAGLGYMQMSLCGTGMGGIMEDYLRLVR